jgi:hypothetical protein
MMRILFACSAFGLLALPGASQQQPAKGDRRPTEIEQLKQQVKELQARVAELEKQLRAMHEKELIHAPPQEPPPPNDELDPKIKTGIDGYCKVQVFPGVPGAKIPPPTLFKGVVTVKVLTLKENTVIAEGKSNEHGRFRIAVPPGQYRVEATAKESSYGSSWTEATVREDTLSNVKIHFVVALP